MKLFFCFLLLVASVSADNNCSVVLSGFKKITGSLYDTPPIQQAIEKYQLTKNVTRHLNVIYDGKYGFMSSSVLSKIGPNSTHHSLTFGYVRFSPDEDIFRPYLIARYVDHNWNRKHNQPENTRSYLTMYVVWAECCGVWLLTQTINFVSGVRHCIFNEKLTDDMDLAIDYVVKLIGKQLVNKTLG